MTSAARKSTAYRVHIVGVTLLGLAVHAAIVLRAVGGSRGIRLDSELAVLGLLLMASEQWPLTFHRHGDRSSITLSGIFACAMLLRWDVVVVITVQALASLVDDLVARRAWWKCTFNIAQYTLSLVAAAAVFHASHPGPNAALDGRGVLAAAAAGCTFFAVNTVLAGTPVALFGGVPVIRYLVGDLGFQASVNGAMAALAPVVIAAADRSVWLIPLLLVPAVAVHRAARLSVEEEHRVRHDSLTGLGNRVLFAELAGTAIADAARAGRGVGVVMMDIDSFKELNDTLGHPVGDELLVQIARRLEGGLRASDAIARLGGDEFAILLRDIDGVADARAAAERLLAQLEVPFEVESFAFDLRASLGIAVYPDHGRAVEDLMRHADVAMYVAKRSHTGCEVYAADRNQYSRRRLTLLNELRPAIARRELLVHYQPKADMRTGRIVGMEALVRWSHPDLGMISPAEFIPLAEHTGLIRPLTDHVLDETFAQLRRWRDDGLVVPVSVNMSARVLQDASVPDRMARRLADAGITPDAVVIELTESTLMAEPERSLRVLNELDAMGLRLSIDDFGTGYSSLAYLSRLPVHEIKIDKSFVTGVDSHTSNRQIVRSTIELARHLGLTVVAEGVETLPEWQTLAGLGCDVVQGYLVSRPVPAEQMTRILRGPSPAPAGADAGRRFGVRPVETGTGLTVFSPD